MTDGRLLTRSALRHYLGLLSWDEIQMRMKSGQIPGPLWAVPADDKAARWDIRSVDRAIDSASNIPSSIQADTADLDQHFGFKGASIARERTEGEPNKDGTGRIQRKTRKPA